MQQNFVTICQAFDNKQPGTVLVELDNIYLEVDVHGYWCGFVNENEFHFLLVYPLYTRPESHSKMLWGT